MTEFCYQVSQLLGITVGIIIAFFAGIYIGYNWNKHRKGVKA